jgi:DNA-binding CsgD family transcriptional regulator
VISGDPLSGRDSELAFIRRALSAGGRHNGVVIVGAAGVGKTRLAREVLQSAATAGQRTNWIVGTESARSLPLGAFAASLSASVSEPMHGVYHLVKSLVAQQRQGRVLIGVDDAHLLDALSAHVVHQLAQARAGRLLVTVRSGADEPDAVTALWKDDLLERLDLGPLSEHATRDLMEADLGGPVDTRSARRMWRLTAGNALFLRQLVKDQAAAGRFRQVAGVWMWDDGIAVSANVSDMVGREMGRLSAGVAAVVDTLSQGEPLSVDVLCDVVRRRDLERAEELRLVSVERMGAALTARLAHPLFGELRRATAGEMYLSRIRGKLAQRLAKDPDADIYATVRRALLVLESDLPPDPQLFLTAARAAMTSLDLELADRFACGAADAGAREAVGLRAMNLAMLGRGAEAERILSSMTFDDTADRYHWTTVRAANLTWMLARPADAAALLAGIPEGPERGAVDACLDVISARCGSAEEKARAAIESGVLPDFHSMMASVALTMAMGALGHVNGLAAVADDALQRATTSFLASPMRFWFGGVYARACRLTGRIAEFVAFADKLADSARDVPGVAYANLALLLGNVALMRGDASRAVRFLHEALAGAENHSVTTGLRAASCFALAEAHAKLGQAQEAAAGLAQARVPDDYVFMQTALAVAQGWASASAGSLSEAVAVVQRAQREARLRDQPTHELACIQAAAQWGDGSGAARARELAGSLSLPIANVIAAHAELLQSDDGEGLLRVSAEYQALGDRAAAADAAAQAAAVLTVGGHRKRGLYAAAIAHKLADECGGLCTPALRCPLGVPLTGRQRDVIELVVAGLSNREIAGRLVMSVRTVEGHVYRACQRLGVKTRDELAALIRSGVNPDGG